MKKMAMWAAVLLLAGCDSDRLREEAWKAGYEVGKQHAKAIASAEKEAAVEQCEAQAREAFEALMVPAPTSTQVCGRAGVNLNGKHIPPGKTGCVRVHSTGRVERF